MRLWMGEVVVCPVGRRAEALGLVLGREVEAGEEWEDLGLMVVLGAGGRMDGVVMYQRLAGCGGVVWAPWVRRGWGRRELGGRLVRAAVGELRAGGVRVVQALVGGGVGMGGDLERGGLPYVTDLLTLSRSTEEELEVGPGVPELRWRGYEEVGEERFGEVLEATYEGSQDMPELVGVRGVGEMRAGQEAIGRFEADLWLVGEVEGEPGAAGVLVLADGEERGCMEVVYLGLTVGARGRGLGRRVVAEAVRRSRGRRPRLELGVDERNGVALRLYRRVGFREVGRRSVYLRVFGG